MIVKVGYPDGRRETFDIGDSSYIDTDTEYQFYSGDVLVLVLTKGSFDWFTCKE